MGHPKMFESLKNCKIPLCSLVGSLGHVIRTHFLITSILRIIITIIL
jgi:hypothetical protein